MKRLLLVAPLLLAPIAWLAAPSAQRDLSDVEVKATLVAGTVHVLEGAGGNIGACVGDDGVLIVDDQFAPLAPKIRAALEKLKPGAPRFVLNTHHHGDHTGGNPEFAPEATVVAHENVRKRLMQGSARQPAMSADGLPVVTFDDDLALHFNGERIDFVHFPHGHTDGDGVVYFRTSNVVHMGDLFFAGRFPFVDLDGGGSLDGYVANVEKVLATIGPETKVIPGHGPLATRADLETFHRMLTETTRIVRERKAKGASLEEAKKAGLPEQWKGWSWDFISQERWIETIWRAGEAR